MEKYLTKNPEKNIIFRCEKVTETEIIDAININIKIEFVNDIKKNYSWNWELSRDVLKA
ncbi:hypothetical protein GOQ27_14060 [Clostridium sp. D2Q-11]|uniref:Uncharacterized protein n=1 Tax=Anaeromonas frigoriresistens TaxID=2683708 RepID=A0A942UUQ6_9FIRM|nr:hypothetical protein [Anaeromonas frigoriresistens]MBS4539594.1 hypothetical protein [Anaeromonas frigoriresistens]